MDFELRLLSKSNLPLDHFRYIKSMIRLNGNVDQSLLWIGDVVDLGQCSCHYSIVISKERLHYKFPWRTHNCYSVGERGLLTRCANRPVINIYEPYQCQ